jgi:hypothetical protein
MAWRSHTLPPSVLRLRRAVVVRSVVAVGVAVLAAAALLTAPLVDPYVLRRYGEPLYDHVIDGDTELLIAELMTAHPTAEGLALLSYEYFFEGELFVGYRRVPLDRAAGLRVFDEIDIEISRSEPELSRLVGTLIRPDAWVTERWRTFSSGVRWTALPLGLGALLLAGRALATGRVLRLEQQRLPVDGGEEQAS